MERTGLQWEPGPARSLGLERRGKESYLRTSTEPDLGQGKGQLHLQGHLKIAQGRASLKAKLW